MTARRDVPGPARYDTLGRIIPVHRFDTDAYTKWSALAGAGEWVEHAACRQTDPEIWFPEINRGRGRLPIAATNVAKAICSGCPVQEPCLRHALEVHEVGIWGGLTECERQGLRERNRR